MTIGTDFSINATGDIRHVAGSTVYDILDLHAWLQDLADNSAPTSDDYVSILSFNPSKMDGPRDALVATRLNLLSSSYAFNIDDTAAQYLKFGSVKQDNANVMYSGLKTIGSIVAASPVYVVQDNAKLSKFWSDGHIQILVKAKTDGALIDSGQVRAYSRLYGQTYSDFAADLSAGGESAAALATATTSWTAMSSGECETAYSDVKLTFFHTGSANFDLGNGAGPKPYWGVITLQNDLSPTGSAQVLQYECREATTASFDTVEGWRYRSLLTASYTPNASAPFGEIIGGKWYVAQGWWLAGVPAGYEQAYQLIDHNGDAQVPPNIVSLTIGGLLPNDRVLAGRDNGTEFLTSEYTAAGIQPSGSTTVVINEAIKADTPSSGYLRIGPDAYTYTSWSTSTFSGLSPDLSGAYGDGSALWVPFIDKQTSGTSESTSFIYASSFTGRVKVRNGSDIQPFETTYAVGSAGGGTNAIRNSDF